MLRKYCSTLVVALSLAAAVAVQAQGTLSWDWTYSGIAAGNTGSGTLTTQGTQTTINGRTGYLITGITGTFTALDSQTYNITSLVGGGSPSFANDNLLMSANPALWQASVYGFAFNLSNGKQVDIFSGGSGSGPTYGGLTSTCYVTDEYNVATYANRLSVSQVPEPSSFALGGLGLTSLLVFRRRQ